MHSKYILTLILGGGKSFIFSVTSISFMKRGIAGPRSAVGRAPDS